MKTISYILVLSLSICIFSCTQKKKSPVTKTDQSTQLDLPGIPSDMIVNLWENCEVVDYIFHDLPFSLNQSETPAIHANINFISTEPAGKINLNCKPMGREFFQVGGDIVLEADIYYSPGCYFYVFVENEKPKYANKISESGMNFYKQITTQVKVGQ